METLPLLPGLFRLRQCVTFFIFFSFFFFEREKGAPGEMQSLQFFAWTLFTRSWCFLRSSLTHVTCPCVCVSVCVRVYQVQSAGFVFFTRFTSLISLQAGIVSFWQKFSFHKHSRWLSFQQESSSSSRKLFYIVQVYNKTCTTSNN